MWQGVGNGGRGSLSPRRTMSPPGHCDGTAGRGATNTIVITVAVRRAHTKYGKRRRLSCRPTAYARMGSLDGGCVRSGRAGDGRTGPAGCVRPSGRRGRRRRHGGAPVTAGLRLPHRRRGMSQRMLAHAIGRSESWMSQVERDILPVGRLSVLQRLADALGVSIYDLEPAELAPPPPGQGNAAHAPAQDLDGVRAVLAGHPALAALLPRLARSGGEATGPGTED